MIIIVAAVVPISKFVVLFSGIVTCLRKWILFALSNTVISNPCLGFQCDHQMSGACMPAQSPQHAWLCATPWTAATRLLCPWDSPGKNPRVGYHAFLQGNFPTQGVKLHLLDLPHHRQILYPLSHWGSPQTFGNSLKIHLRWLKFYAHVWEPSLTCKTICRSQAIKYAHFHRKGVTTFD